MLDAGPPSALERLRALPDVAARPRAAPAATAPRRSIDVASRSAASDLRFFSVVSTIGTPLDVTAQELRVEAFFPSDEATRDAWPPADSGGR